MNPSLHHSEHRERREERKSLRGAVSAFNPTPHSVSSVLSVVKPFVAACAVMIGATAFADVTVYRVGKVLTMDAKDTVVNNAAVVVRDNKIESIGKASEVKVPDGATVIEMGDCWLFPGMVDAHNHIAGGLGDLNDMVYLTNPGLRTLDTISPDNDNIKQGRAGGVTSVLLIPGSGTNISGFGTLTKLGGKTVDEMIIKAPGSLKIAQAGNPERYWYGVGRSMMNYNTRRTLLQAMAYHERWVAFETGKVKEKPAFDP